LIGVAAVIGLWAGAAFLIFLSQTAINNAGSRLAAGEPFRKVSLSTLRPELDRVEQSSWPVPESLHNAAAIELHLSELELEAGEKIAGSPQFARTQRVIEAELRTIPLDAFAWAALFWLRKTRDGMSKTIVPYLRMSYRAGPHEGWIAVNRNRTAVTVLSVLPKDLADLVTAEFADLVASDYTKAAAEIVTGPGWANRELLLNGLANVPQDKKRNLADALYERGFDLVVPGVEPRQSSRPWP
jgi:hypothetical protein